MAKVTLKSNAGVTKTVKVGFSWTTFFFGAYVALFRGNFGEFAKWLFLNPITIGIWGIAQCWTANKKNVVALLEKGYTPATDSDRETLVQRGIISQ